jgi:hypothetical protein
MPQPLIVHNVYFALTNNTAVEIDQLVASCRKYLTPHPGIVFFACGQLTPELKREVNDRDFDVGLHIIFESLQHHDDYQVHPLHVQFINENKPNWKKVRVFDSTCEPLR